MLICFFTGCSLKAREARKTAEAASVKAKNARVAFEYDNTQISNQQQ